MLGLEDVVSLATLLQISTALGARRHMAHICLVPFTWAFALEKARASAPGATTESEEELCFH